MTANIEYGLKYFGPSKKARELFGALPLRFLSLVEFRRDLVTLVDRVRVQRSFAPCRRSYDNLHMRSQYFVRMGKLRLCSIQ